MSLYIRKHPLGCRWSYMVVYYWYQKGKILYEKKIHLWFIGSRLSLINEIYFECVTLETNKQRKSFCILINLKRSSNECKIEFLTVLWIFYNDMMFYACWYYPLKIVQCLDVMFLLLLSPILSENALCQSLLFLLNCLTKSHTLLNILATKISLHESIIKFSKNTDKIFDKTWKMIVLEYSTYRVPPKSCQHQFTSEHRQLLTVKLVN